MKQADVKPKEPMVQPVPINEWLQDIDANHNDIIQAIREGKVVLTSKTGIEKIRQQKRDDTKKILELSGRVGELQTENGVLLNTLVNVLTAFKGVAAKGPEIVNLVKEAGIDQGLTGLQFGMKLVSNPSLMRKLIDGGKDIIGAFDATPLSQIDGEALLPILNNVGFDFSEYDTLIATFAGLQKPNEENG